MLTEQTHPQHPAESVLLLRVVELDNAEDPVCAPDRRVVGWLPSRRELRPVVEDEIVTTAVGGMVDGLTVPLWGVPLVAAGQQRRSLPLFPRNRVLSAGMAEGHPPAVDPMLLDICVQMFWAAVADLRERSTARANDRRAIPRVAALVAVSLGTWEAMAIELPKEARWPLDCRAAKSALRGRWSGMGMTAGEIGACCA